MPGQAFLALLCALEDIFRQNTEKGQMEARAGQAQSACPALIFGGVEPLI